MTDSSDKDNTIDDSLEQLLGEGAQLLGDAERTGSKSKAMVKCPICREKVDASTEFAPFCSKRCKTIDLGKWVSGDYKISRPVEEEDLDQND